MVLEEIVDDESLFPDVGGDTGAAAAHLLVEDGRTNPAAHHKMEHLAAVEAGIKHPDRDGDTGIGIALEFPDESLCVRYVRGDDFRIVALCLRVEVVEHFR